MAMRERTRDPAHNCFGHFCLACREQPHHPRVQTKHFGGQLQREPPAGHEANKKRI
jgi:hypothetical protein